MKRRKVRKALAQRLHAKKRASQRFGLALTTADLRQIAESIRRGNSTPIERQSNRVTLHRVEFKGEQYRVVYDRKRKEIVTFLPAVERAAEVATEAVNP